MTRARVIQTADWTLACQCNVPLSSIAAKLCTMSCTNRMPRFIVIRHGATEWSKTSQHTGRTDLPLLEEGIREALHLGDRIVGLSNQAILSIPHIGHILRSPRTRCAQTLDSILGTQEQRDMIGLPPVQIIDDAREWDYGKYEGQKVRYHCI